LLVGGGEFQVLGVRRARLQWRDLDLQVSPVFTPGTRGTSIGMTVRPAGV
jgi:hypothetical protein